MMIWDNELGDKEAKRALGLVSAFAAPRGLSGEWVTLRFKDGKGGGCQAEGALLSAEVLDLVDGQQVDLHLGADEWRVW